MAGGDLAAGGLLLRGRGDECVRLDGLVVGARAQRSGVLMLRGEAGVGKTALLEYAVASASGLRVVRVVGVESEMELAFAALHQLCAPLLELLPRLAGAQREALQTAFGLGAGAAPDRFLVGLAALSLLSEAAEEQPLLCVIDDAQWLDRASAQALAFVARRMLAEPVVLLFAAREPSDLLGGLPEMMIEGLGVADARALLASVIPGRLDEQIANQIIAETRGNPLALLELPRALSPGQLTGGFGLQRALPGRIEESFRNRLETLPQDTQRLLLLAAAEPTGDPAVLWRAAEELGIDTSALEPAETAGLIEINSRVMFRHPLVRSALYRSATSQQRRDAHHALARTTDDQADPDRRAWHLAEAAARPDEAVATELERAADRAQARGGLAAAAAFLERATALTPEAPRRAQRALAAAQTKFQAGALDDALALLDRADTGTHHETQRARVDLLRAQIAFFSRRGNDAAPLLLKAALELEKVDPALARETYLEALAAAMFAGRLARPGGSSLEIAQAARAAPPCAQEPRAADLLLDGFVARFIEGYEAATPILRQVLCAFSSDALANQLRWTGLATLTAQQLWDDTAWQALSERQVRLAREQGALGDLTFVLAQRAYLHLFAGELQEAASLVEENQTAIEVTGTTLTPSAAVGLIAVSGRESEAVPRFDNARNEAKSRGEGYGLALLDWAEAVLHNGSGRYEEARDAAMRATQDPLDFSISNWVMVELIEAAARAGDRELAAETHGRLAERTGASGTEWALGIEARSRALLNDGDDAERHYREAVERLTRTRMRLDLARAHLLYGEWLRHRRRRLDAREQLLIAHQMFTAMGAEAFAARAERELATTGARVPGPQIDSHAQLTAQETQIARLASEGLSNAEIGAQLFISRHTVAYHLRKVFTKLDITSRTQLADVL